MFNRNISLTFFLLLFAATLCLGADIKQGNISGRWVTQKDGPMTDAQVLLFNAAVGPPPSSDKYLRVPDEKTTIDNEGKFSVQVPAGRYYLVMRKRFNENTVGPPQDGDMQYYSRDKKGNARIFVIKAGRNTDIGIITEATVFQKQQAKYEKGMTAIEGTVTDEEGMPVEGVRVFAYASPEMAGRPRYASGGTGKDGKYVINVKNSGVYYLKARSHYGGGQPEAGEFMGGYGDPADPAVVKVNKGEIRKGVNFIANRFPGRGKKE